MATAATIDPNQFVTTAPTGLIGTANVGYDPTKATASDPNAVGYNATQAGAVNAGATGYTGATGTASTYDPTKWMVDQPQTVQGQISGIINKDAPLMQLARTGANQDMASRGLVNSSMAVGAGEDAVLRAALPIAQQDASTYANSGQYNATAANTANQFDANQTQDMTKTNIASTNAGQAFTANAGNSAALQNSQLGTSVNVGNTAATNQAAAQTAAAQNAAEAQRSQQQTQVALSNQQAANNAAATTSQQRLTAEQQDAQAKNQVQLQQLDANFKSQIQNATGANQVTLQQMQGDTSKALANIQADYQTLMNTSTTASSMYNSTLQQIGSVVNDQTMDAASKATSINGFINYMKTGMNMISSINGVDTGNLLNFGTVTA